MKKQVLKLIFTAVLLSVFGSTFSAQTMNEDFRKNAPEPLKPVPFNISKPFETTLDNGLKVVIVENDRLPLVSYRLAFLSGNANEPRDAIGVTSAITSLLNEGTKNRTSKQIADEIERLGANISASAGTDNTIISGSSLSFYSDDILKLMADMVLMPSFPENEVALYKQNTLQGLQFQRSNPGFLASEQVSKILYGDNPYSVISPSVADVEKITRENLMKYHDAKFIPNNAVMVVVGNVKRAEILKQIKENFGDWKKGTVEATKFPVPPVRKERTLTIVDRPGSAQSNIVLANLAFNRNDPDYYAALVMNKILGSGGSARLFMNLREEKSYTYGAYSNFDSKKQAGDFSATAEVRNAVTGDSLKEFFYEFDRIRKEKVSEKELKDAKNFLTGVFPLRAETQEGLTNLIVSHQLYNLPGDYLQTYRDKINAVTLEDVERIAKKYVTPDKQAVVIVGDAGEILPQIKPYATTISIFDINNKPQTIDKYTMDANAKPADFSGKWNLKLAVPGQEVPITLNLTQDGDTVSGSLDSMLGKSDFSGAKVKGNKMNATANVNIQGQALELKLNATIDGDSMNGTVSAPMFPAPIPFTGTKEK